jgi:sialate O-acetylesterase
LQRGRPNAIWGWDNPGQRIDLRIQGPKTNIDATTYAGKDGHWQWDCPELSDGGPYTMSINGSSEELLRNVLVGEVWLASGQSNMEWKISAVENAELEISHATHPQIRMFNVEATTAGKPSATVEGEWLECTPETADSFSAVGYYFALELHKRLGVPVGILHASWGGTPIQAWTSLEALRSVIDVEDELGTQGERERNAQRLEEVAAQSVLDWESKHLPSDPENTGLDRGWASPEYEDAAWHSMRLPCNWQSRGLQHNGVVWFRLSLEIPSDWVDSNLVLSLGAIDDFDTTYFNGNLIGAHPKGTPEAYRIRRRYGVPKELVRPGRALIAVRVFDHFGEGGLIGPATQMKVWPVGAEQQSISLSGDWKYEVEHVITTVPGSVFETYPKLDIQLPQYRLATLFNAMITPLIPYGMRGALWYQGESNVEQHRQYRDLMIAMIRDWRSRWYLGQFPFLYVQLPNFKGGDHWPYLREAQEQALSEPNTAMAVTLDIGSPADIHPRNKREVGRRLALLAMARCYGQSNQEVLGPKLSHVEIVGPVASVYFDHSFGLTSGNDEVSSFELAGADRVYHPALAVIQGGCIRVTSAQVQRPVTVRYAWHDAPEVNLRNAAGLPAAPFRTDCY